MRTTSTFAQQLFTASSFASVSPCTLYCFRNQVLKMKTYTTEKKLLPSMCNLTIAPHTGSCYPLWKRLYLISLVSHLVLSITQWERNKLTVVNNWHLLSLRKASCMIWSNCFWDLITVVLPPPSGFCTASKIKWWEACVRVCPCMFLLRT